MHIISVNDTDYEAIEDWTEMPCSMAVEVQQTIDDMPVLLRELYDISSDPKSDNKAQDELYEKVTLADRKKHFPLFYGEIMRILTTIPGEVMEGIMWDQRTAFYKTYCGRLVQGILYGDYSNIKNIESFDWETETYYLPTSDHFLGNTKPMANEQTIVFVEVVDLELYAEEFELGKYQVAPNIISLLCRPKDEEYDEKKSLERAEKFKELPMDIVWEVFFCIQQLLTISSQNIQILQLKEALDQQRKQRLQGVPASDGTVGSSRSQKRVSLTGT